MEMCVFHAIISRNDMYFSNIPKYGKHQFIFNRGQKLRLISSLLSPLNKFSEFQNWGNSEVPVDWNMCVLWDKGSSSHRVLKLLKILSSFPYCFQVFFVNYFLLEPMDWSPCGPCAEMKNPCKLFLVELLHRLPKPFYDIVAVVIWSFIFCVIEPVLQFNKRNSVKKHFKFIRLQNWKPFARENFLYPCFNVSERSLDFHRSMEVHTQFKIQKFVRIVHLYFLMTFKQFNFLHSPSNIVVGDKVHVHFLNILCFLHEFPVFIKFCIESIDVLHLHCPVTELAKDSAIQIGCERNSLKNCFCQNDSEQI